MIQLSLLMQALQQYIQLLSTTENGLGLQHMKIELKTSELKNALSAIEAIMKKTPNDNSPGDSPIAFLRRDDEFSLISIHDIFSAEIKLPEAKLIGTDDQTLWQSWDGDPKTLNDLNVLGLVSPTILTDLSKKLNSVSKTIILTLEDRMRLKMEAGSGKEYFIDLGPARKIVMSYDRITANKLIIKATPEQYEWFVSTISGLGKIVKPTATRMSFGCVALSGFPSKQQQLVVSGSSDVEGYAFIYDSKIASQVDFTALVPKNIAESLTTFMKALGTPSNDVEIRVTIDENNPVSDIAANRIAFVGNDFSVSFSCVYDVFPFDQFYMLAKTARQPYCKYITTQSEIKSAMDRISLFAQTEDAVTELSILDGGTVELVEKLNIVSSDKPARETCSDGTLSEFPDEIPSLGTIVRTNIMKTALTIVKTKEMSVVVCEQPAPNVPRRLALLSDDGFSELTAVLLGLRS